MTFPADSPLVDEVFPAANVEPRRNGHFPSLLILHYTGMRSARAAIEYLARADSKVSCHYVVDEAGTITQMVAESQRAWHAGLSCWHGATDINSLSIGIEIQNPGHEHGYPHFPSAQMRAVAELSRDICERNAMPPEAVLAHSDVAPARKIDPGEKFDWQWLADAGVGHWVRPARVRATDDGFGPGASGVEVAEAQLLLRRYGYGIEATGIVDIDTAFVLKAFQRHFRPRRVDGRLDRSTLLTLERLHAALPDRELAGAHTTSAHDKAALKG